MVKLILELLLVASPVILAAIFHMVVVRYDWASAATYPLDHKMTFRSRRIFGDNKTYRGVLVMIIASIALTYLYVFFVYNFSGVAALNLLDFEMYSPLFYGVIYGLGYVIGELPNSFVKRQLGITDGKSTSFIQRLVDQLDSVVVILLLLIAFSNFTWNHFWSGIIFYGLLHLTINYLLYLLNLRKEPY
ncbi:MAG: CDP-archaeol synthase [Crocinitomicaceae bacterium]